MSTYKFKGEVDAEVIERLKYSINIGNLEIPWEDDITYITKQQLDDIKALLRAVCYGGE